jgi:hypothetical protein
MLLFLDESVKIYHELVKRDTNLTLIIDATEGLMSGLPSPLVAKKPLLYTILVGTLGPDMADFPVCEFTSTRHTYADVAGMMLSYFEA